MRGMRPDPWFDRGKLWAKRVCDSSMHSSPIYNINSPVCLAVTACPGRGLDQYHCHLMSSEDQPLRARKLLQEFNRIKEIWYKHTIYVSYLAHAAMGWTESPNYCGQSDTKARLAFDNGLVDVPGSSWWAQSTIKNLYSSIRIPWYLKQGRANICHWQLLSASRPFLNLSSTWHLSGNSCLFFLYSKPNKCASIKTLQRVGESDITGRWRLISPPTKRTLHLSYREDATVSLFKRIKKGQSKAFSSLY
jgi:hypothetical protein